MRGVPAEISVLNLSLRLVALQVKCVETRLVWSDPSVGIVLLLLIPHLC